MAHFDHLHHVQGTHFHRYLRSIDALISSVPPALVLFVKILLVENRQDFPLLHPNRLLKFKRKKMSS